VTPLLVAAGVLVAIVIGMVAVRSRAGVRVDVSTTLVVDESPPLVLERIEQAARRIRGYACERRERELVIFRRHEGPLGFFDDPQGLLAEATMDLLHVIAERKDGRTEVWLKGRSEPRVVARIRRTLARAR